MPSVVVSRPSKRPVASTVTSKAALATDGPLTNTVTAEARAPNMHIIAAQRRMDCFFIEPEPLSLIECAIQIQPHPVIVGRDHAVAVEIHAPIHLRRRLAVAGDDQIAIRQIHYSVIV